MHPANAVGTDTHVGDFCCWRRAGSHYSFDEGLGGRAICAQHECSATGQNTGAASLLCFNMLMPRLLADIKHCLTSQQFFSLKNKPQS